MFVQVVTACGCLESVELAAKADVELPLGTTYLYVFSCPTKSGSVEGLPAAELCARGAADEQQGLCFQYQRPSLLAHLGSGEVPALAFVVFS